MWGLILIMDINQNFLIAQKDLQLVFQTLKRLTIDWFLKLFLQIL